MVSPRLVVTVTANTMADLRRRRDSVADADLVELRLDGVADPDPAAALAGRRKPVIVTCRPQWEGGLFQGSEEERRHLLASALSLGAEYDDVEWRAGFTNLVEGGGDRIVLSFHDFEGIPPDLTSIVRVMRENGAAIIKLAVRAHRLSDCLPLLSLGGRSGHAGRIVLIAMGEAGLATRVLASRFGSIWSYAGHLSAVGQIAPPELLHQYRLKSIDAETEVYGLVGSPVSHSVSPAMHNAAFCAHSRNAVYLPLPAADADDFVEFARALGMKGASVTIPFKVALAERVDESDASSERIGAINTVRVVEGRWFGRNTDVDGFLQPLRAEGRRLVGVRAAVLGAGGSARAVAVALMSAGAVVTVHARHPERAARLADLVGARSGSWPVPAGSWDMLVNCTPIGMYPEIDASPVPDGALTGSLVYDLVYNPLRTRLVEAASARGCHTIGGLDMLVAQAGAQYTWWTGLSAPLDVMRAAALRRLAEFSIDANHVV